MSTQQALWLPGIGQEFVVGPREIDAPGPDELLVKIISSALDWKLQKKLIIFYPVLPSCHR